MNINNSKSELYDNIVKHIELNPLPIVVPPLPESIINNRNNDNNKPIDKPVDYSLVYSVPNSNPLFGYYNFIVLKEYDVKEIVSKLKEYFNTIESISYEFTYYDCSWTVVDIENNRYGLYYIRLFQEAVCDGEIDYHIYFKRVHGCHFDGYKFYESIRFLFNGKEESTIETASDTMNDIDVSNVFAGFLDLDKPDDKTIENRSTKAIEHLKESGSPNEELEKYKKSEFAIKDLVDLSTNDKAKQYFTPDVLSALLEYWISIVDICDLTLTSTKCAIIFYNILLTETTTLDVINPLICHCIEVAKKTGNVYDEQLRLKANKIIKIIANRDYDLTDEKRNQICQFLVYFNCYLMKDNICK